MDSSDPLLHTHTPTARSIRQTPTPPSRTPTPLAPAPLPQPHAPPIQIRHAPLLAAVLRDTEPQHQLLLTDQLVQKQQLGLIGAAAGAGQLKRADQSARHVLDAVPRGRVTQGPRVDAEHVDLALAPGEVGRLGPEVELEAEGAGSVAGEVGEGDDEVLPVRVAGVLGDVEGEGDAGGAAGLGVEAAVAAAGGEARAVGGAVGQVAAAVVLDREVGGQVREGGVDLVGGGGLMD